MWKISGLILACFLIYATAEAAVRTPLQTAATAVGNGIPMTVDDKGSAGMTVTGTFDGTIAFEGSADGGTTWSALTCTEVASLNPFTTTTTTGQYQCPVAGLSHARGRISVFTSGSITVVGTASNGSLGSAGGVGVSATATAAAPSYVEGYTRAALSVDLSGGLRTSLSTLLSCEDQPNNLCMTSGGAVRQLALGTSVSTNTTGSVVLLPVGVKNIQGRLVCNAGGSTNCGITIEVLGSYINSTTGGVSLCTLVIPTGTATLSGSCPPMQVAYSYWWYVTTGVAGTSPVLNIYAQY